MALDRQTGHVLEVRPDGWNWGSRERDGSLFAIIYVTEEWMNGMDWMAVRRFYTERDEDGNHIWSVNGDSVFQSGIDTGLTLEYATMYGTVPDGN